MGWEQMQKMQIVRDRMIELAISGRSEGLAASSAITFFWVSDGSITQILSDKLSNHPEIELPFQILGIYVEAISHDAVAPHAQGGIGVKEVKRLSRFHTGQMQKLFELTISKENFYSLPRAMKESSAVEAFKQIAETIKKKYEDSNGESLAALINEAADEYLAREVNSSQPI